ncbi:hypothetical protein GCM10020219_008380 [Nonomuraea dietziae]
MVFGRSRDFLGAKAFNRRLSEFMPLDLVVTAVAANPVERGLADCGSVRRGDVGRGQGEFRAGVEAMTASWVWELANHIQNRVPDPVDYVEMRRKTFGSDMTMLWHGWRPGGRSLRGVGVAADDGDGRRGQRLLLHAQRPVLLPEGDRVRGRAAQHGAGRADVLRL